MGGPQYADDFLAHYGIKGMRWGKRSRSAESSSSSSKEAPSTSSDHEKASELKTKKISSMSNAELKALNNRMQLEKTYSELMSTPNAQVSTSKGMKYVKDAVAVAGTVRQVYDLYNSPMVKDIKNLINQAK